MIYPGLAFDPAGITADQAIVHGGIHYRFKEPIRFRNAHRANAGVQKRFPSTAYLWLFDIGNGPIAEGRVEMAAQHVAIDLDGCWPEVAFLDPGCGVFTKRDLARCDTQPANVRDW